MTVALRDEELSLPDQLQARIRVRRRVNSPLPVMNREYFVSDKYARVIITFEPGSLYGFCRIPNHPSELIDFRNDGIFVSRLSIVPNTGWASRYLLPRLPASQI